MRFITIKQLTMFYWIEPNKSEYLIESGTHEEVYIKWRWNRTNIRGLWARQSYQILPKMPVIYHLYGQCQNIEKLSRKIEPQWEDAIVCDWMAGRKPCKSVLRLVFRFWLSTLLAIPLVIANISIHSSQSFVQPSRRLTQVVLLASSTASKIRLLSNLSAIA